MRPRDTTVRRATLAAIGAMAVLAAGCAPFATPAPLPAAASAQALTESQVTIVHGLRGQLVDVYVDGAILLDGFEPDRLTDPVAVSAGVHTIDLRPAGTPATDPPRATASPNLPAGPVSVVAHFAPDNSWTMTLFTNVVGPLDAGTGRIVFRNTAAVSPVAVSVAGGSAVPALESGKEAGETLPAASYAVQVGSPSGATIVPDDDIAVDAGVGLFLYLVGQGDNVTWLSQRVAGQADSPVAVAAGNSGLVNPAAGSTADEALPRLLIAGGLVLVAAGTRRQLRQRRRPVIAS